MKEIIYSDKHYGKDDYLNYHGRVYRLLNIPELTNEWEKQFLKSIYINNYSTSKQWTVVRSIEKRLDNMIDKYNRTKEINSI